MRELFTSFSKPKGGCRQRAVVVDIHAIIASWSVTILIVYVRQRGDLITFSIIHRKEWVFLNFALDMDTFPLDKYL